MFQKVAPKADRLVLAGTHWVTDGSRARPSCKPSGSGGGVLR